MAFNKRNHLIDNISAIKTAFEVSKIKCNPNDEQIQSLNKYRGFGGLKCVLNPFDKPESWPEHEIDLFPLVSQLFSLIKENVPDVSYQSYVQSIRNNTLTGFYTPPQVIDVIAKSLKDDGGIVVQNILDPCAGTGAFLTSFSKNNNQDISGTAFEKDLLTGLVLKAIHKDFTIRVEPYEESGISLNHSFDLIASNIPLGIFTPGMLVSLTPKTRLKN